MSTWSLKRQEQESEARLVNCLRLESTENKRMPKCSEIHGGSQSPVKERSQQLLRQAPPGDVEPLVLTALHCCRRK